MIASKLDSSSSVGPIDRAELVRLMARVAQKDRAAFVALYAATSAKLYGIVFRILRQRHLTDDVLQEIYVKIWNRAVDFDPARSSPITWMAVIARNRALDEVRKKDHASTVELTEASEIADAAPLALDALLAEEGGNRLRDCLQSLDPQKRDIVVRAYIEGASREQLAQMYATPVPTIKTWLHRSLSQLKDCLGA